MSDNTKHGMKFNLMFLLIIPTSSLILLVASRVLSPFGVKYTQLPDRVCQR